MCGCTARHFLEQTGLVVEPPTDPKESMPMPYGLLLQLLFIALGVHYVFVADASAQSKAIIGGLLLAPVLFAPLLPAFVSLSTQFGASAYILVVYRLQDESSY